jgi:single stranded DNA-binding protein
VDWVSRSPKTELDSFSFFTPLSAPSIGHGFGGIPAPGSFGPSAFPFPPKKSQGTAQEISCAPPEMQTLALGADPSRFQVPQLRGQKGDSKMYENRVELMGFLGKNPESKSTKKTGRTLAILSLATKTWWTGTDEQRHEKTEWHRIIVWNGLADYAADKLKKGDHLYVVGTLVSNVYEKEVGKGKTKAKAQITAWQIKAFSIRKLDRKESVPTAPATEKTEPEEGRY